MAGSKEQSHFLAALNNLSQVERAVFLMSARDDLDYAQIGFRLGLSVEQVERLLAEALLRLGDLMGDKDRPERSG